MRVLLQAALVWTSIQFGFAMPASAVCSQNPDLSHIHCESKEDLLETTRALKEPWLSDLFAIVKDLYKTASVVWAGDYSPDFMPWGSKSIGWTNSTATQSTLIWSINQNNSYNYMHKEIQTGPGSFYLKGYAETPDWDHPSLPGIGVQFGSYGLHREIVNGLMVISTYVWAGIDMGGFYHDLLYMPTIDDRIGYRSIILETYPAPLSDAGAGLIPLILGLAAVLARRRARNTNPA